MFTLRLVLKVTTISSDDYLRSVISVLSEFYLTLVIHYFIIFYRSKV